MNSDDDAAGRLKAVQGRVTAAAREAGRAEDAVTLIAVSKTFAAEDIVPVIAAGQRVFGENRVQEAKDKWPALRAAHPRLELHLIGPLQSNKVRDAVALFDAIHTLDRVTIARAVAGEMAAQGRSPKLFIQVNTGLEPQKAGIAPGEVEGFVAECRDKLGLSIAGLMCIPPVDAPPEEHFRMLARLAADLGLSGLSMGMSADFEPAIRLGATHVRVGSAIFGTRPKLA
jgi:PLP dependent protein